MRLGTVYPLTLGSTSVNTSAFGSQTYSVRVAASKDAYVLIGGSGLTASSTNAHLLPAGAVDYLTVTPGQILYTVQGTTLGGTVTVSEIE